MSIHNVSAKTSHAQGTGKRTEEENYWLGKLPPDLTMSSFADDHRMVRPGKSRQTDYSFKLPNDVSRKIVAMAGGSEHGVYIIVLSGIQYLLSVYTGRKDAAVGTPAFKAKSGPSWQDRYLILHSEPEGRMTFKEHLLDVKQTVADADKHRNIDYGKLYRWETGEPPRPRTFVLLDNIQNDIFALRSAADTTFRFNLEDACIRCSISYHVEAFAESFLHGVAAYLIHFLETVLNYPDVRLSEVGIPDEQKQRLLAVFNDTAAPYPKERTVIDWFEDQVAKTPERPAVVYRDLRLTYAELNARANRVAHALIAQGIGEGSVVGIMVERSLDMPVGMLGIMKTGGAYLPIDPNLPEERIRTLLGNSKATLILTDEGLEHKISDPALSTIRIRSLLEGGAPESAENPGLTYDPEGVVYVLYTSGTTGVPKGVMVKRRSFINLITWFIREANLNESVRLMLIAPVSFDTAHKNVFAPLLVGGQLHLFTAGMYDYDEMSDVIERERIDVINCSPSALYPLIDYNEKNGYRKLSPLKQVILGGESINMKKLKPWLLSPQCGSDVINTYGPTECTDIASSFRINRLNTAELDIVPIGKPLPNVEIDIVDDELKLLPIGVAGELCIGGDGLSYGYYNAPELTSEKFVDNPNREGREMYKTGDLARWTEDGTLEFLGRKDFQTKVRGFRVELGEIESCLLKHRDIEEAVAVAMTDAAGGDAICAYFVSHADAEVPELRSYMARKLPEFMVPAYFMRLNKLPLNNNGKIDRKALPAPDPATASSSPYAAPENGTERLLAEFWEDVLGVERVGVHDDFFELGGHSLKAASIVLKMNRETGVGLQISDLFRHPTIRELAEYAVGLRQRQVPAIGTAEEADAYPVPSQQKRLFILWQLDRHSTAYNLTSLNMLEGRIDLPKLKATIERLIERHETLRTSFAFKNGKLVQTIRLAGEVKVELSEAEESRVRSAVDEFIKPFDLEEGPLVRVKLLKLGDNRHLLMTDIHHIVFDGASMDIVMQEFSELYAGRPLPVPELQYKDYSAWQAGWSKAEQWKRQESYWLELFRDGVPELRLNTDYPRRPVMRFDGAGVTVSADGRLTAGLRAAAAECGATLYMLLLAAVNVLLYKYTDQEDIVIGSPTSGRGFPGLERAVGMFVNTVVMRNFPAGDKTFSAFLGEVKENTLGAFENEQYPLEELVERLGFARHLGRNPMFDVIFSQESGERASMDTGELVFREYPREDRATQIDLSIRALEKENAVDFRFKYRTDLFAEDTITNLARHFMEILEGIVRSRSVKLQDIRIMSEPEEERVIADLTGQRAEYDYHTTVQELFVRQAKATPAEVAVVDKYGETTYAELEAKACRLARVLRERGVRRGDIIGIASDPSTDRIVAVLGVLMAGGAYLPLDPDAPAKRIRYMLEDSGCSLVAAQRHLARTLELGRDTVILDEEAASSIREGDEWNNASLPGDLAYVMYTSGTTGQPKGAMIEHRSVTNLLMGMMERLHFDRDCRHLLLAKFTFDVSVQQMLLPLVSGGCLVIPDRETAADPERLWSFMEDSGVNVLGAVPGHMTLLLDNRRDAGPNVRLRYMLLAGEPFTRKLLHRLRGAGIADEIVNLYGPTEATVYSSLHRCGGGETDEGTRIGRPLPGYRLYILDRKLRPVPRGVTGELYISGAGVGRGYLKLPELTGECFLPDPFAEGETMYKSGDLARQLPDGGIEYLGRADHQVKINGIRIELGEIGHTLLHCGGVKDAAVAVKTKPGGEHYLCAYVVADEGVTVTDLREYLAAELSGYMIPERFVRLDRLPMTVNGKVDLKALQTREDDDYMVPGTIYEEPATDLERAITEIWQEVLGRERVGRHDHFFELGGNSLSIVQANELLKRRLQADIPVVDMFRYSTVHALARRLGSMSDAGEREENGPDRGRIREDAKSRLQQRSKRRQEGGRS
ncbi:non-ribosomal peptide synthetase [Paenibacillus nasutitermitis]|uniref:Carrier domain-containing protein n=1 Tax=Paenibacillus nasutitermitis TaxID=1652958 RepID=A0A916ZHS0_9BACL|nr:non-ribosomal peptide synthetase [Paenibacillus nasutitermitis]GGD98621.1 hypothetical protein GCM10010911_66790 [Paenibacillus nasutitermitis]